MKAKLTSVTRFVAYEVLSHLNEGAVELEKEGLGPVYRFPVPYSRAKNNIRLALDFLLEKELIKTTPSGSLSTRETNITIEITDTGKAAFECMRKHQERYKSFMADEVEELRQHVPWADIDDLTHLHNRNDITEVKGKLNPEGMS